MRHTRADRISGRVEWRRTRHCPAAANLAGADSVNRSRGISRDSAHSFSSFSTGYIATWSKGDPSVITDAMDRSVMA